MSSVSFFLSGAFFFLFSPSFSLIFTFSLSHFSCFLPHRYWESEEQPESSGSGGGGGGGGGSGSSSSEGGAFSSFSAAAAAATSTSPSPSPSSVATSSLPATSGTSTSPSDNYCIIESRESVKDFAALELGAITEAIRARRNRIYFLMEEVRRLRIQERLKSGGFTPPGVAAAASSNGEGGGSGTGNAAIAAAAGGTNASDELANERFPSAIPFFPAVSGLTVKAYGQIYAALVTAIILFGGLAAPVLEVKLGIGGASYAEIIQAAHLPRQLAAVDPIVASFCGGAVGVLTTLLIVENNNAALVASNRCVYCGGTGYVACGACAGAGVLPEEAATALEPALASSSSAASSSAAAVSSSGTSNSPLFSSSSPTCSACSGTGKVACIGCLCTGKKVARETDQRLDPFS